ncbi:MAG: CD3324 family protein [Roseburia sp.]|nr:CD3324 family protein [Ruminococcus sp.]MCM1156420.1 CD3324 family protein [Roseburia sp.]MCM1242319.1 CD3324 family protein [Roseburia sp.]
MSYVNAGGVLPEYLVKEIQKYVDGQLLYIPRKCENALSWGEKSGTKDKLAERNREIVSRYYSGESIINLSEMYFLSEKRVQGIIHAYESSEQEKGGGFTNE